MGKTRDVHVRYQSLYISLSSDPLQNNNVNQQSRGVVRKYKYFFLQSVVLGVAVVTAKTPLYS